MLRTASTKHCSFTNKPHTMQSWHPLISHKTLKFSLPKPDNTATHLKTEAEGTSRVTVSSELQELRVCLTYLTTPQKNPALELQPLLLFSIQSLCSSLWGR